MLYGSACGRRAGPARRRRSLTIIITISNINNIHNNTNNDLTNNNKNKHNL